MSADFLFAVPLLVRDIEPDLRDAIQAKVAAYLGTDGAKRVVVPAPEESVATSYYHPEASILEDAELEELEKFIFATANSFLQETLGLERRRLEVERAWINLFEPGMQEAQHTHDGSLLSCSYYVEAPEDCGCIIFPDPIGARRSYRQFTQTVGDNLLTRPEIAVEPKPGRLVMFESWMPHAIQCNKSDKRRISIAINLRQLPDSLARPPLRSAEAPASDRNDAGDTAAPAPVRAAPRPFLFNEVFAVNKNLHAETNRIQDAIPTIVMDDFLKHPDDVRELVGSTPAANWKHEAGGRNFIDYYDCRMRFPIRHPNDMVAVAQQTILKVSGLKTRPADASVDINWFMQINEKRADFAMPHCDITENVTRSFTCVLYLNGPDECSGGTAFLRFKKSGSVVMDDVYARAVTEDPRIGESGVDYWPEQTKDMWELVGDIEMAPGRFIIFPSEVFHAAHHPENSFFEFPRLTLAFWMIC